MESPDSLSPRPRLQHPPALRMRPNHPRGRSRPVGSPNRRGRRGAVGADAGVEDVKIVEVGQATLKGVAEPVKVYGVASERLWKRPLARPDGFLSQQPSLARNLKALLGRSRTLAPRRGDSILVDVLGDSDDGDAGSLSESWAEELSLSAAEGEEGEAGAREPVGP